MTAVFHLRQTVELLAETVSYNWCGTRNTKLSLGCMFDEDNSALTGLRPSLNFEQRVVVGTLQDGEKCCTA